MISLKGGLKLKRNCYLTHCCTVSCKYENGFANTNVLQLQQTKSFCAFCIINPKGYNIKGKQIINGF